MTRGEYVAGAILVAVLVGSLAVTASVIRGQLLPTWAAAPNAIADIIIGLAVLVLISELLGTAGEFKRWPLILSVLITAAAVRVLAHKAKARGAAHSIHKEPLAPHPDAVSCAVGFLVVAFAVVVWIQTTLLSIRNGMLEYDTLNYHMPFAAHFAQDASITRLVYVGDASVSFYPMNSELIHAAGILLLQRDILSPLLNLGWLGLALLSGWCIGRPSGAGPATMAATALVAALPVMASSQAGTAKNDIMALALLLAAVALLVNAPHSRPVLILAALSAGLAAGTRLNLLVPVIALGAVVILSVRGDRRFGVAAWSIAVVVGSGFWYLRNLVEVGNPLPWFGLKIAGLLTVPSTTSPAGCGRTSIADYADQPGFVRAHLLPQLPGTLGAHWWIVVACAGVGVCAALLSPGTPMERSLGWVALASGAAYVLTPTTAGGVDGSCFASNTRFAAPALALGTVLLALVLSRWFGPLAALTVIVVALVLNVRSHPLANVLSDPLPVVVFIGGACVAGLVLTTWRVLPRSIVAGAVLAAIAVIGTAGWYEQRAYLQDHHYERLHFDEPIDGPYAILGHVREARIAVMGFAEVYPFYGRDLSNRVELPTAGVERARFVPYSTCVSWIRALQRGRYDYVVTAQSSQREPPAANWTRRDPNARELLRAPPGTKRFGGPWRWELFKIVRGSAIDPSATCAGVALSKRPRKPPSKETQPPVRES